LFVDPTPFPVPNRNARSARFPTSFFSFPEKEDEFNVSPNASAPPMRDELCGRRGEEKTSGHLASRKRKRVFGFLAKSQNWPTTEIFPSSVATILHECLVSIACFW
jgi:hypothetical protein